MKYSARFQNNPAEHQITLKVGDKDQTILIAPRATGGSSVSGGELLFLALATCYRNDIYHEAAKRNINVESMEVEVNGDFEAEAKPASNIVYFAEVKANASEEKIRELIRYTDTVAEVQNTLRIETPVSLELQ